MWGGGAQSVDNGTGAWGQGSDAASGWGDPEEPGKASGWGNPSPNPSKPGQYFFKKKRQYFIFVLLMMPQNHKTEVQQCCTSLRKNGLQKF